MSSPLATRIIEIIATTQSLPAELVTLDKTFEELDIDSLDQTTGWTLKPEGVCRDEVCVPLPRGRENEFVSGERFNIAAFACYMGQPIVQDGPSRTWAIGEAADTRASALRSLEAPDFTLPDMAGVQHSLSDYRGRKVFLVSWASW